MVPGPPAPTPGSGSLCSPRVGRPVRRCRCRPDALGPGARRPGPATSRPWSTWATTWCCTACTSAPTSTRSPTPWPAWTTATPGWGVAGETWNVLAELTSIGGEDWFALGDRDLATHLFRTGRLQAGEPLGAVTATLAARRGVAVRLLPVTDDALRTRLTLAEASALGPAGTEVSFQDYFVRLRHEVAVRARPLRRCRAPPDPGPGSSRRWTVRTPSSSARPTRSSPSDRSSPCPASARRSPPVASTSWRSRPLWRAPR